MTATLARMLGERSRHTRITRMFVDSQPGAAIVEWLRALGYENVEEVSFGGKSPDPHFANMRAYMWGKEMKDWLARGSIDPEDAILRKQISYPGFKNRVGGDGALIVESKEDMKKRGIASPDDADALALTFAFPVVAERKIDSDYQRSSRGRGLEDSWMRR
jgi:hypothetical protein